MLKLSWRCPWEAWPAIPSLKELHLTGRGPSGPHDFTTLDLESLLACRGLEVLVCQSDNIHLRSRAHAWDRPLSFPPSPRAPGASGSRVEASESKRAKTYACLPHPRPETAPRSGERGDALSWPVAESFPCSARLDPLLP